MGRLTPPPAAGITKLGEVAVAVAAPTIDLPNIPQGFRHLLLRVSGRSTEAAEQTAVSARFNVDAGANYDWQANQANGVNAFGYESLATTGILLGYVAGASAPAGAVGAAEAALHDYRGSLHKSCLAFTGFRGAAPSGSTAAINISGFWRNVAAINRVTLVLAAGNFDVGTVASLYGLA